MAGWFSRLTQGGERPAAEPAEFSVACGCGSTVTGTRNRRMQVVVCRKCATQLCILPASPYPRPKLRAKKKPLKPALKPLRELTEEDIEVVTPTPTSRRTGSRTTPKPANKQAKPGATSTFQPKSKGSKFREKSPTGADDEFLPTVPRAKIVTPLRLISLGMICLIFLAGWWTMHRRAVQQAALTFADTAKAGRAALAKSEYDTADEQFRKAVKALDLLGREDREARQVRQLARESAVANGLSSTSLFELISESRQTRTMSGSDWQQALTRTYRGAWFLFESNALQFDGTGGTAQWKFAVPLVPGEDPIQIRGDFTKWSKVLGDKLPSHLIFAGQLEDIVPATNGGTGWELVLNGHTLVLWTDAELYKAFGGGTDETTLATLKSQAQHLGVTE
ncbi:MAG: hypothetical protein JWM11_1968 [Planctomycetaceae bacterium]|nr:hypothetical protein [Planctomycetaceae bacterium]